MSESATALEPGTFLLGKYRIDEVIGRGGMGVVLAATHVVLEEKVAIKVLRADVSDVDEARGRFLREAQAAVKLKSEHVSRVQDVGVLPDGAPYMVMEFLDGTDLAEMIERQGKTSPGLAVDFVLQACEGLAEAHARGIVHRDIKPSNVFVTWRADGSPLVKILDFGISRAVKPGPELSLTRTASVLGTPAYMSPEQMRSSRKVDARTDLWSLGVVLYELLEARWPFAAESFTEMCAKVAADDPDPMTCAPPLRAAVLKCLEKNPEERYANAAELATALAPFANNTREATLRVERIVRLMARQKAMQAQAASEGWEGGTLDSSPVIPVAPLGDPPVIRPSGPAIRASSPVLGSDASQPFVIPAPAAPTLRDEMPKRSSRVGLIAGVAVVVVGVAVGGWKLSGSQTPTPTQTPAPTAVQAPTSVETAPPPPVDPVPPTPVDPTPPTPVVETKPVTPPVPPPTTPTVVEVKPETKPQTKPETKPAVAETKPVTKPVTKPTTKPITKPVTVAHPTTKPETKPVIKPTTKPTTKPTKPTVPNTGSAYDQRK